ncbi:MAG: hypothetical protein NT177_08145 [Chloroflexi bacterium]|nr:hypothetical protein [Chloroflexota bacterium]
MLEVASDAGGVQFYAIRVEPVGRLPDQMTLVEDVLFGNVRLRDAAGIVDGHPKQLSALDAIEIFGLGQVSHVQ